MSKLVFMLWYWFTYLLKSYNATYCGDLFTVFARIKDMEFKFCNSCLNINFRTYSQEQKVTKQNGTT